MMRSDSINVSGGVEVIGVVNEDQRREGEALARHVASAGWQVVAAVHSPAGVELHLHPALHVWDFPRLGRRFAYGRDDWDALRRFVRQLDLDPAAGSQSSPAPNDTWAKE
jgi:hypothetical protein